jgi:hypothetical protein
MLLKKEDVKAAVPLLERTCTLEPKRCGLPDMFLATAEEMKTLEEKCSQDRRFCSQIRKVEEARKVGWNPGMKIRADFSSPAAAYQTCLTAIKFVNFQVLKRCFPKGKAENLEISSIRLWQVGIVDSSQGFDRKVLKVVTDGPNKADVYAEPRGSSRVTMVKENGEWRLRGD